MNRVPGTARGADELVARIGNEGRSRVADQRHRLGPEPREDPVAFGFAAMIVIYRHRRGRLDMSEQFGGNALVLGQDQRGPAQCVAGARGQIGKIADRGRDDIEAGGERFGHRGRSWHFLFSCGKRAAHRW